MEHKRASWSGQLAFVLAAAASAIGLGNLWRFPYLAAQYGGGTFILVYLCLVVTLGFTLMLTEIAIGRKTQQSQLTAYNQLKGHGGLKLLGVVATVIPLLITPYYCVIGGWVLYYLKAYALMAFTGAAPMGAAAAESGAFFTGFISAPFAPFGYGMLFILACAGVILLGVKNGIEKSNLVMMPILFIMAIAISLYVIFMPGSGAGLKYYLVPNMDCLTTEDGAFSFALLGKTILGAMGQMFYSLSLAMGIMVTYGSYMKKQDSIEKSVRRIEVFDTLIAVIAGLMIIPVVYMFAVKTGVTPELIAQHGGDVALATKAAVKSAMNAGPGLMFITLPKVFATVASVCDVLHIERKSATFFTTALIMFLATFSAIGYGPWAEIKIGGMPFLDFFDFITNSVLMPVTAAATCIFVGWILTPKSIIDEVEAEGNVFKAKGLYVVMVKWFAPALVIAILVSEICRALGIGGWKI